MFKVSLFVASSFLLLNPTCFSQSNELPITRAEFNLNGSVKTIKTTTTILGAKPEDDFTKTSGQTFNETGYLIEGSFDLGHGVKGGSAKYVYNEKNQIVEIIDNTYDKSFVRLKNTYDDKDYITEQRTYNSDGKLDQLYTFIYNDKMEVVLKELRTDPEKNPEQIMAKYIYRYNAQSKVFELTEDWMGFKNISKYSYNAKGKVSEEHHSTTKADADESQNYSLYLSYNEEGWLIGIVHKDKEGKITKQESFVYDHLERLTHHNQLNALGKVEGYTQYSEFDETADNWTKSVTYEGKKIISTEVREITYF